MAGAAELTKLVTTACNSAKLAEDSDDKAEEGRAVDALKLCAKQAVTAELLKETEAGKKVNKLIKHPRKAIAEAASAAVQAWKECVKAEQATKAKEQSKDAGPAAAADGGQSQSSAKPAAATAAEGKQHRAADRW